MYFTEDEYLYREGDVIKHIHFSYKGIAGFVHDIVYLIVEPGDFLGLMDMVPGSNHADSTKRKFSVQCLSQEVELLQLSLECLDEM